MKDPATMEKIASQTNVQSMSVCDILHSGCCKETGVTEAIDEACQWGQVKWGLVEL